MISKQILFFFDYDAHQTNLSKEDDKDVLIQMLESFDNETENGKLYISYPMVEALRDYDAGICGNKEDCFVAIDKLGEYKNASALRSFNPHIKDYDIAVWKDIIDVFAMRLSCLFRASTILDYDYYSKMVSPYNIYELEEKEAEKQRVFVLSAFPEFLIDYFGVKLWKTSVKHAKNLLNIQNCKL